MKNPYVGPRAFRENETLYGRGDDAARLFHLLLADRIVLLYSPSGAGKTSLLEAQLTRRLREEDFHVIYDIRVHREPAEPPPRPVNRYLLSVMLSIEKALPEEKRSTLASLSETTFGKYIQNVKTIVGENGSRLALLFDQFEEIFRLDETDVDAKREFFTVIGKTLREDRSIHAVFAMREDSIAMLDDYCELIPTRLRSRQRLALLTTEQAIEAIRKPAEAAGVDFRVAEELVRDLSRTTVMLSDGSTRVTQGVHVEPVQLQVVCFTIWEKKRRNAKVIDDLKGVSVDNALGEYYASCVAEVAIARKLAPERVVREWFTRVLITPRGIRSQVLLGMERTEGLANTAIQALVEKHIVRREVRGGREWFELAHDRLVNPIRTSNEAWNATHLTPLQSRAAAWHSRNQDAQLLWSGRELIDAIQQLESNPSAFSEIERAFIERSRSALSDVERATVAWELAGRPAEKLLAGPALKIANLEAKTKGEYRLTAEARSFLAESRAFAQQKRSERLAYIYMAAITASVVLYYFAYLPRVREREQQQAVVVAAANAARGIPYLDPATLQKPNTVREAIVAQNRIEELVAEDDEGKPKPIVHYYAKEGDSPKLMESLKQLGVRLQTFPAQTPEPTNCIWYGDEVDPADVKLVAFAVIRAGSEVVGIQKNPQLGNVIRVGHNQYIAGEEPLSAEDVEQKDLDALGRSRARLITESAYGVIRSYDPAKRSGEIDSEGETIGFRIPPARPHVNVGDSVAFVLFQNAKRKYAVNVRPPRPPDPPVETTAPAPTTST